MPESEPAQPATRSRVPRKWQIFLVIATLSLIADQATKIWARGSLPVAPIHHGSGACIVPDDIVNRACQGGQVSVVGEVWDWRLSMNPGSAFGLLSNHAYARSFFSIIGIIAVIGMLWMVRKARDDQKILHWALALVAGGAVGNLIDRVYYGVVTDFILWHYKGHEWPVFNVADVVLVVGVLLMFLDIRKESRLDKVRKAGRQEKAKAAGLIKSFGGK